MLRLQKIPPEVVASWPKPNYVNPETRGSALYVINGIFFSLAMLALSVRLYMRIFVRKWIGLDDVFIFLAFVCIPLCGKRVHNLIPSSQLIMVPFTEPTLQLLTIGMTALLFEGTSRYGWDRHIWDGPMKEAAC
jgi:hypothetical protein